MKNKPSLLILSVFFIVTACTHNAVTGRSQLSLVSEEDAQHTAKGEYKKFLATNKVVDAATSNNHLFFSAIILQTRNALKNFRS